MSLKAFGTTILNSIESAVTLESAAVSELKTSRIRHLLVVVEIHVEQNILQKPLGKICSDQHRKYVGSVHGQYGTIGKWQYLQT